MNRFLAFTIVSAAAAAAVGAVGAAAPGPATSAKADLRDRVICRRFVRTGSLVDGYRICKTRAEWDREQDNLRQLSLSDSCSHRGTDGMGCNP